MANIFKYGRAFDITIISFICGLILIAILMGNTMSKKTSPDVRIVARAKTELLTSDITGQKQYVKVGDTVTIMGQDMKSGGRGMRFWIETSNGRRGWAAQEAFDNRAIVYGLKEKDADVFAKNGDTVTVVSHGDEAFSKFKVKTKEGRIGELRYDNLLSITGNQLLDYCINFNTSCFMTVGKFNKLYMGKSFEEVDKLHRQARYVTLIKNGKVAEFSLSLFNRSDGKFYYPIITFENGVATSCEFKLDKKTNSFLLKYIPLVNQILDIPFFSNLINGNMYEGEMLIAGETTFTKILGYVLLIPLLIGFVGWLFFTNSILALLIFGSLRFRYPLVFLSDKLVWYLMLLIEVVSTYIWAVLGLCYAFHWWYFLPILIYLSMWLFRRFANLFGNFPSTRCPQCKYLYTIKFSTKKFEREYDEWRPKTEQGPCVGSHTERWQTVDRETTTTTYSNGARDVKVHDKNIQNHHRTINHYQYNEFKVLYHIKVYRKTYKCEICGREEYAFPEEPTEIDRKFIRSYIN